jgi:cell division protein FtsL
MPMDALIAVVVFGIIFTGYEIFSLSAEVREASARIEKLLATLGNRESNDGTGAIVTALEKIANVIETEFSWRNEKNILSFRHDINEGIARLDSQIESSISAINDIGKDVREIRWKSN